MIIDCDTCEVRGLACDDCVVSVLLGAPGVAGGQGPELDDSERAALDVLAGTGTVRPRPTTRPQPLPDDGRPTHRSPCCR